MSAKITPASLADFLERENPRKCRNAYDRGSAHCALGWARHLNYGNIMPDWVHVFNDSERVADRLIHLSDSTPGWGAVIAFLRCLTANGRVRKGVSV